MPYPKPADQAKLQWTPPLPFYGLGQNICVSESSKRSYNSNKALLKTNESNERSNRLNHTYARLELNSVLVVTILMINL